jgi:acyl carrier protein phosphodiesterase
MNFLAHLYLSRHDEELMIGNFIADSVKGKKWMDYSPGIAKGIQVHRLIDSFTDQHPVFNETVKRLRPGFRKYAGVVADIFYDHFLAAMWEKWHEKTLKEFTEYVHKVLLKYEMIMPDRSRMFLSYMIRENIPMPYASISGIEKVLYGMSRRTSFENNMAEGAKELEKNYEFYKKDFELFFPDIILHVKRY